MASLTNAIHMFQRGDQSREDFIAEIDRALAAEGSNSAQLLEILSEEHTKVPLPPELYAEVQRHIEHRAVPPGEIGDETRMQTERIEAVSPRAELGTGPFAETERVKGVGDTLNGRFELTECLGVGGMGTVYKALDLRKLEASDRNPYIAIKVLNVQFRGHPKSLIALQREAKKAQTLAHPNIVTVYDFDRDGAMVYLTMEYLSGQPLNRVLRAPGFTGMPYAKAMRIVEGMGRALAYAHQRGFVHCDFKPANVFLTDSGGVKVIDFGIARVFQRPEEDSEATVFDPGSLGGLTPAYASAEMLEHREPDPRDDLYALGCITYELLTGRHPFDRQSATQARAAGLKPQKPPHLGNREWRGLRAALCFEREHRTPSVARFLEDMDEAQRTLTPGRVLAGAGAVMALVLGGSAVWYWGGFRGETVTPPEPPLASAVPAEPVVAALPAPGLPEPAAPAPAPPEPVLTLAAVTPILSGVPCSALVAVVDGSALKVDGYVPERYGTARLKEALGAIPGVKRLEGEVAQVADDQCKVIEPLAPYWVSNQQAGRGASIRMEGGRTQLVAGDQLVFDVTTPGFDGFVHVDYHVQDGSVVHLVPNPLARQHQAPPNYTATIGGLGNWVIGAPFGTELIALVVSPVPLFDELRAESESRTDYMQALGERLSQLAAQHGRERIAVDFVQITTRAP